MICIKCGNKFTTTNRNIVCSKCRDTHLDSVGYLYGATNITAEKAEKAREKIVTELGCFDMLLSGKSLAEIAEYSGLSKQQVYLLFRRKVNNLYSYQNTEEKHPEKKVFEFSLTWPESLYAAVLCTRLYENMPDDAECTVEHLLETLTEREKRVLLCRYKDDMTLEEVAMQFELTRERVRQIGVKALRKLRHPSRLSCLLVGLGETQRKEAIVREAKETALAEYERKEREKAIAEYEEVLTHRADGTEVNIDDLNFSVRSRNVLVRAGIRTLADIDERKNEIRQLRNLGRKSFEEIRKKCAEHNIFLSWEREEELIL